MPRREVAVTLKLKEFVDGESKRYERGCRPHPRHHRTVISDPCPLDREPGPWVELRLVRRGIACGWDRPVFPSPASVLSCRTSRSHCAFSQSAPPPITLLGSCKRQMGGGSPRRQVRGKFLCRSRQGSPCQQPLLDSWSS